jgi:dimethylargininase
LLLVVQMFTRALTRLPSSSLVHGITAAGLGAPDPARARQQHRVYVRALEGCGLQVDRLPPAEAFPDSVFIEDVAVCTPSCVIVTRPAAASRRGEVALIEPLLRERFDCVEAIVEGTLDGGDVMAVGTHYFIGLSTRTSSAGARELTEILARHGLSGSMVACKGLLHLKTGLTYLEDGKLLGLAAVANLPPFRDFERLIVPPGEDYAANCVRINEHVLMPAGYPRTKALLDKHRYQVVEVDSSEFRKLDGGLSCLSLRY